MKFSTTLAVSLATTVTALPGMANMRSDMESRLRQRDAAAAPNPVVVSRDLGSSLSNLGKDIEGLLGSVYEGPLDPNDRRPEPGYDFQAPGPNDSRGPCPGLNTLANHGYLPRNGYVSASQVIEAVSRGFNMGTDLATVLAVFAVLSDGSIKDESWYLGTNPSTGLGGLQRHSTVEADISVNREDFYNGCGDNHHLSSRLFKRNVQFANEGASKQFDIPTMAKHFAAQGDFAKEYNPTLYYFPFPMIVSVVAFNFYPRFFANGTNEFGGPANYESISSIIGAKYQKETDEFMYVPERFPENWYRRSFPYGAVQALTEGFTMVYPANPILPPGSLQLPPESTFNVTNLLCGTYQGINSITPLALGGEEEEAAAKIGWALGLLDKAFDGTLAGCHKGTVSKNFFPDQKKEGGPLNPGPHEQANAGNNVYNKVYFPEIPYKPTCNHVA